LYGAAEKMFDGGAGPLVQQIDASETVSKIAIVD
jgi:hypothetical protein